MGSMASRDSSRLFQRCSRRVYVKGDGDVHVHRKLGKLARGRTDRVLDEGDAAEVRERRPRETFATDVLGRQQLVGCGHGPVERELAVAVLRYLDERERRACGRWLPPDRGRFDAHGVQGA
jgi:hypothetical protein